MKEIKKTRLKQTGETNNQKLPKTLVRLKSPTPHRPVPLTKRGIGHVGLKVSNLEKSRKFYREILGLKNETKGKDIAFVPSGSDLLVLYEAGAGMSDFHFGFRLDSPAQVEEWKHLLKSKGIRIYEDIAGKGHPRSIKFRDPDGHWIEIASRS